MDSFAHTNGEINYRFAMSYFVNEKQNLMIGLCLIIIYRMTSCSFKIFRAGLKMIVSLG